MSKKTLLLFLALFLSPSAAGAAEPGSPAAEHLPGQVLIRVEEGVAPAQVERIAASVGAKVDRRVGSWGVYLLSFDAERPVNSVIERLQGQPGVRYAEPNAKVRVNAVGGDPGTITAAAASGIVVAVLDTGVDFSHSAFSGRLYSNPGEIAGNGLDDDANGYVDDVHGWDFYEWDNDPSGGPDDGAHGTMVAGRVLQGAQGSGISILPLQVGPGPWLDLAAIVEAIDYAVNQGARVINMSFGASFPYRALTEAIQHAAQRGALLVAAAGNSGSMLPSYPAAYPGVVSVAASNNAGQKSWWSNYGGTVDFTASGENVTTTDWGGGTANVSGTSFSAPFVAGVLARILAALPGLTADEAVQRLRGFVKDVYALNHPFFRGMLGYGLVDDEAARQVAEHFPPAGSVTQPPQQPDSGLKAKLEAELAAARQEAARLQAELSAAEQNLAAAQQAAAAAQLAVSRAGEKVDKAWKELIESWQAWYRSFFGSPAQREALRIRREQAWNNLYKAMAERREALARLRVAQAEEIKARERRTALAAQLRAAQAKVSELERRLSQMSVASQVRPQGSAHQSEIEQLLQKLHAVTHGLGPGGLPEGIREVSDLYLPDDSRQALSSD